MNRQVCVFTGQVISSLWKVFHIVLFLCLLYTEKISAQTTLDVNINASSLVIEAGDSVAYFDQSEGSPVSWLWSFPGGVPSSSTAKNPVVTYPLAGTYEVTLTIADGAGTDMTKTFPAYVKVQDRSMYWWNNVVFYEVFVRSFKDSNGDGQGDIQGLLSKLDYLNDGDPATHEDLGITALWLMPLQQSPSYHGYDVMDYRTIEQDYGTNEDFKTLIAEAHKRGIKVIIDFVMNHTSSQHPWFLESTASTNNKRDWYVWQNPKPVMTGPWGQTVWYPKNGSNYYAIFWSEMPDLNYSTSAVKDEMFDVARYWLSDMDVDGFRLDAVRYIFEDGSSLEDIPETIEFWQEFRAYYKSVNADALAVGEAWTSTSVVKDYTHNDGLDFCFEFDLATAMISSVNSANPTGLKTKITEVMDSYSFLQYGTFLTNHDINRVMDQLGKNSAKAKVAAELLFTLPGIPFVYYGEEIGMTGSKPDENIRTPMQWTNLSQAGFTTGTPWRPVNADYTTKNVEVQRVDENSLWNSYRELISLRQKQNALRHGNYIPMSTSSSVVFSFLRQYKDENIIVVSNLSASVLSNVQLTLSQGGITPGIYQLVELRGGASVTVTVDEMSGFSGLVIPNIPGRTTLIYKLLIPSQTTTTFTFEVDMNAMITAGEFNPILEAVDIIADFSISAPVFLSDNDGDGIYTLTMTDILVGTEWHYKYRINGINDGREEYPASAYLRQVLVPEDDDTVRNIYRRNVPTGISLKDAFINKIYPIPTNDILYIPLPAGAGVLKDCKIFDVSGKVVLCPSLMYEQGLYSISLTEIPCGVYGISLWVDEKNYTERIVVFK